MSDQLTLGVPEVPEHRVQALAGVLAGFRWPKRGSFEALKVGQKKECLDAARLALERLETAED